MSPLVRAAGMQGYKILMEALRCTPSSLLQRNGLNPSALDDPEALVSLCSVVNLLEESAIVTRCPDFGLRLAGLHNPGVLGVVALVINNAPTVARAIADASRYLHLHSPAFEINLENKSPRYDDCFTLRFEISLPEFIPQRQTIDTCMGHIFQLSRALMGDVSHLRGVSLPHTPVAPESAYRNFFHAPIFFEESYAGLHVHRDALQVSTKSVNPLVHKLALEHVEERLSPCSLPMTAKVRRALVQTLGVNRGTKLEISALLSMHPRTLQRWLERENVTFETIRDDVYKAATLRFLQETSVPLKHVAGAIGLSEQSALTRSCKRWFGRSPSLIRSEALGTSTSEKTE